MVQRLTAEGLGTFLLVFLGCGSFVFAGALEADLGISILSIALAFGGALTLGILAFGRVSGAHFNPAVSVAASVAGRQSWKDTGLYAAVQVGAAVVAGLVLFVLLQGFDGFEAEGSMGQTNFGDEGSGYAVWSSFLVELLLTLIFVFVILSVTDRRTQYAAVAPAAIGLTLVAVHLVGIPLTGSSVNPARSIGPALFAGGDSILQLWLYILAPLLGAAIAGFVYPLAFGADAPAVPGSGLNFTRPAKPAAANAWEGNTGQQWATQQTGQQQVQTEYPGWKWDPASQQWVADQSHVPDQGQVADQGQLADQAGGATTGQHVATDTGQDAAGQQAAADAGQQQIQTEYPGWKWDAQAQQWVPDQSTAPQWPQSAEAEEPRTQIRPNDGSV